MKLLPSLLAVLLLTTAAHAQAPRDNRYDTLGKIFAPIVQVLLTDAGGKNRAMTLDIEVVEVKGRLPKQFEKATLQAAVQYPDKVRLDAPVLGEQVTVCRNGNVVWAIPDEKVEFLLSKFKVGPEPVRQMNTPLALPITAQQAVFLPALFQVEEGGIGELNGEEVRVLQGGLMPELARATKSEDFQARLWVGAGYVPKLVEIRRKDFTMKVAIRDLKFVESLPAETWQPPAGETDVFKSGSGILEKLLYVVMNSLQMSAEDAPWTKASPTGR